MRIVVCLLAVALSLIAPGLALGAVKVPPIIASHMVLQRDVPVSIWGTAAQGEQVVVKFRDQQKTAIADADGRWLVKLDALALGEPATMTISGANTITLEDVLVGEVWVGSGQSNMGTIVKNYEANDPVIEALANQSFPQVRLAQANGRWTLAVPKQNHVYSALLFTFGVRLHQELHVPVGLIVGAVGGTASGHWLTKEMLDSDKACQDAVAKAAANFNEAKWKARNDEIVAQNQAAHAKWEADVAAAKAKAAASQPATQPDLPKEPRNQPLVPKPGEITTGKIGDLYTLYVHPAVPFTIRGVLWDQGESDTQISGVNQYILMGALIAGWRKEWGQGDFPFIYVQKPSGGGCAFDPADPVTTQASKFAPLPSVVPNDGQGREMYIHIMQYPNTGMVISSDLGGMTHPINKSGYGTRAARVALGMVYAKPVEYYGPVFESMKVDGGKVHVSFTHVGKGLVFLGGDKLQGFTLAGSDKVYYWADATIDEKTNTVILQSPKVPAPAFVRYGYAQQIPWANLFNKDGLPAVGFRSDAW